MNFVGEDQRTIPLRQAAYVGHFPVRYFPFLPYKLSFSKPGTLHRSYYYGPSFFCPAQVWHAFSTDFTVLPAHPSFIRQRNERYLPFPSHPKLVLIYWPAIFLSCIFSSVIIFLIFSFSLSLLLLTTREAAWYIILVVSVCLYVYMYVCPSNDNFRKHWRRKFVFAHTSGISLGNTGQVCIWRSSGNDQGHRSKKGRKSLFPQCTRVVP